jgi:hypothetical protein
VTIANPTPVPSGSSVKHKLVYTIYDLEFSFKEVITRHPEAAGSITECLSGAVNKDYSQLYGQRDLTNVVKRSRNDSAERYKIFLGI